MISNFFKGKKAIIVMRYVNTAFLKKLFIPVNENDKYLLHSPGHSHGHSHVNTKFLVSINLSLFMYYLICLNQMQNMYVLKNAGMKSKDYLYTHSNMSNIKTLKESS